MKRETLIAIIIGVMVLIVIATALIYMMDYQSGLFHACEGLSDLTNITYRGEEFNCGMLGAVNTTI